MVLHIEDMSLYIIVCVTFHTKLLEIDWEKWVKVGQVLEYKKVFLQKQEHSIEDAIASTIYGKHQRSTN